MKSTIVIAYPPGGFGTYVNWLLDTLCSDARIIEPFTANGTSHNFKIPAMTSMDCWEKYLTGSAEYDFVRIHPKTTKEEKVGASLNRMAETSRHVINLYPSRQDYLWAVNNQYFKVWKSSWEALSTYVSKEELYVNWPISPDVPPEKIPHWIIREFLSLSYFTMWEDQLDWYLPDYYQNSNVTTLYLNEIFADYQTFIDKIKKSCGLEFKRDPLDLEPYHKKNKTLQKYMIQDQLSSQYLEAVLECKDFNLPSELTIVSQAWIQKSLRENGLEIRCHGLDQWPNSSLQLEKYTYRS